MIRDADRFEAATDAFHSVESHAEGPYLHEYDGVFEETDESVRIITLAPEFADNEDAVEAFERVTGQWYNANTHPNIITVVDRETTPQPWIALDQPHDITLRRVQSEPTPAEIETVVTDTAEALRTIGLYNAVHGALSPDDILVIPGDDDITVQIGGFGLEHAVRTALGEFEPTPYTAPELLEGPEQISEQADVYGLGAITYFALTGQPPVDGDNIEQAIQEGVTTPPSEYDDAVSPALDEMVFRALSTEPSDRYDSPHNCKRAFISAFDTDDFETAEETTTDQDGDADETESTTDSDKQSGDKSPEDATTAEESPPDDGDAQTDNETDDKDQSGRISRRGALTGLTGVLGLSTVGGLGWAYENDAGHIGRLVRSLAQRTPVWGYQTEDAVESSPAVVDGTVYVGSDDYNVYALSAKDGTEQWSVQIGDAVESSPAVVNGTVYAGSGDTVYALSADDGTQQWSVQIGDAVESSPAVVNGTVYAGSEDDTVYALSADDGTEQWSFQTWSSVVSSPAVVDRTVYIGGNDGYVYALSVDDGTEQWAFQTGGEVLSSPAVVDGTVYVGSGDNNVYAVSADDGTEQWSFQTGSSVKSSPAVVDGTVYVGSDDGWIYAIPTDGPTTESWPMYQADHRNSGTLDGSGT